MTEETTPVFRVNGKDYPMPTSFTVGEMCDAERYFGVEFGDEAAGSSMRMAAALLWIAVHREDPKITVENIRSLPPEVFADIAEADARPPEMLESGGSNGTSGGSSENDSDPEDVLQKISGVPT